MCLGDWESLLCVLRSCQRELLSSRECVALCGREAPSISTLNRGSSYRLGAGFLVYGGFSVDRDRTARNVNRVSPCMGGPKAVLAFRQYNMEVALFSAFWYNYHPSG